MPTALPIRLATAEAARLLSWPATARLLILLLRVRWLNRQLVVAHQRVDRLGLDVAGPDLLLTAQRWLATHQAIAALLGRPEPDHVTQVRATLRHWDPSPERQHLRG